MFIILVKVVFQARIKLGMKMSKVTLRYKIIHGFKMLYAFSLEV